MHKTQNIKKILEEHAIYELVNAVAKRARQVTNESIFSGTPQTKKSVDVAIEEFERGVCEIV